MKTLLGVAVLAILPFAGAVHAVAQAPLQTTTSLVVTGPQTGPLHTIFTFTATVTDANGPVKLGRVTFYKDDPSGPTSALGTVVLDQANGTATLKTAFVIGDHPITAKFVGTNTDAPSTSSSPTVTVTGKYSSGTTLFFTGSGSSEKLVASVAGQGLLPITGTVTFTDTTTNTVLGTVPLNTALLRNGFEQASALLPPTASAYYQAAAATGDFNGDGRLDLAAISDGSSLIQIFLGKGDGTFAAPQTISLPLFEGQYADVPTAIAVGDVNGDGKLDLLVTALYGTGGGTLYTFLGHGDGTFTTPQATTVGYNPNSIAVGDFNGDGKLDVAVLNLSGANNQQYYGSVSVLLGHGNGEYEPQPQLPVGTGTGGMHSAVEVGDFNSDARTDLIVCVGGVVLFPGEGDGSFGSPIYVQNPGGASAAASGDFNGDGKLDLAIVSDVYPYPPEILLGHGNRTFEVVTNTSPVPTGSLVTSDFNNDGKLDLATLDEADNEFLVLLGHGTGTLLAEPQVPLQSAPYAAIAGDFSSDGVAGLAISSAGSADSNTSSFLIVERNFSYSASSATAGLDDSTLVGLSGHTIAATYNGDADFTSSTGSIALGQTPR